MIEKFQKKEFTSVLIPKHILKDQDLTPFDKIIYAEIASFTKCFMKNSQLGKKYSKSEATITRSIGKLKKKKYIIVDSFNGRMRTLVALKDKEKRRVIDNRKRAKFMIDDDYIDNQAFFCGWKGTIVYFSLCRHANKEQESFPSIALMAKQHGVSRPSILSGLNILRENNLIEIKKSRTEKGKWLNNTYVLIDKSKWIQKKQEKNLRGSQLKSPQVNKIDLVSQVNKNTTPSKQDLLSQVNKIDTKETHIKETHNKETHSFLHLTSGERAGFINSLEKIYQSTNGKKIIPSEKNNHLPIGKKTILSAPQKKIPKTFTEKVNELQIMEEGKVPYQDVTEVISFFLPLLPNQFVTKSPFLQKPTQSIIRKALTINTKEELKALIEKYQSKQTDKFRPRIATVHNFFSKIDQIKAFLGQSASGLHAHRSISSPETKALNEKNQEEIIRKRRIRSEKIKGMSWEDYKIFEKKEEEEEKAEAEAKAEEKKSKLN